MKHKIKVRVAVEKKGLLGTKKTVMETRSITVDEKTYEKMKKELKKRPLSMEEMMYYDFLLSDD